MTEAANEHGAEHRVDLASGDPGVGLFPQLHHDIAAVGKAMHEWVEGWASQIRALGENLRAVLRPLAAALDAYYSSVEGAAKDLVTLTPLAELGWALSTFGVVLDPRSHREAAEAMADSHDVAAAHLAEAWSSTRAQRRLVATVPHLYDLEHRGLGKRRRELLDRAVDHFEAGRFEEVVLLVYSQLDGLVQDVGDARGAGTHSLLFGRPRNPEKTADPFEQLVATADTVLADERSIFLAIRDAMRDGVTTTTLDDSPSRHGVMHGRVLGYGTKLRAAQCFAFLAAVLELLVALYEENDDLPLWDDEADESTDNVPDGLAFLTIVRWFSPVRAIYVAERRGTIALVTKPEVSTEE